MNSKVKKSSYAKAESPIILRCHRLMEAFAKSDEERDFYIDTSEGFLLMVNLDKPEEEITQLENELKNHRDRYSPIPKLTFYEQKKIMEGFVHEKVYDIDTKEKLMDIIQSKEAREHFLEFIYDHLIELEKWQQYYQERSRIRIIEWLRQLHIHFVFEEDLEIPVSLIEKLKENLFEKKLPKELEQARKVVVSKAKSYYSSEALNPRPKRGRPPKQIVKQELEPEISKDIYTTVPPACRSFLFTPDITSASEVTFSSRFEQGQALIAQSQAQDFEGENNVEHFTQKLTQLRGLSSQWAHQEKDEGKKKSKPQEKATVKKASQKPKATPKKRIIPKEPQTKKAAKSKKAQKTQPKVPTKKRKILLRRKKVK